MKYLLIVLFINTGTAENTMTTTTAEFNSKKTCLIAAQAVAKRKHTEFALCTPKGQPQGWSV